MFPSLLHSFSVFSNLVSEKNNNWDKKEKKTEQDREKQLSVSIKRKKNFNSNRMIPSKNK